MASKIRNILIFLGIALVLVLVYFLVFKKSPEQPSLVSSTGTLNTTVNTTSSATQDKTTNISKDFLNLLLNVRNIKIDEAIFSDPTFLSLRDSTIELVSDGNEGRPNPFAPLGVDSTPVSNNFADITVVENNATGSVSDGSLNSGEMPIISMPNVTGNSGTAI
jgi:hypothetical protein